jgi:hypothetical protein
MADLDLSDDAQLVAREIPKTLGIKFTTEAGAIKQANSRYLTQTQCGTARLALVAKLNLDPRSFILTYNGQTLTDDQRISELHLPADAFLEFRDTSLVEFRLWNDDVTRIRIAKSDTAGALKSRLAQEYAVNLASLKFEFVYDNDDQPLSEILPQDNIVVVSSSVDLTETIGPDTFIDLEPSGEHSLEAVFRPLLVQFSPSRAVKTRFKETATVAKMKASIGKRLEIAPDSIVLPGVHTDATLLVDVLGPDRTTLAVEITDPGERRPLLVKLEDGTGINAKYRPGATVKKVRIAVANRLKVDLGTLSLLFDGTFLQEDVLIGSLAVGRVTLTASLTA